MGDAPGDPPPAPVPSEIERIVLTGFMGAGKSTVGPLLAERTGWAFVDLDTHIETAAGKDARTLFAALGEAGFRQLESNLWADVLGRSQAILAPGGAVIDEPENQRLLAANAGSFVIFLDAPFETLIRRCLRQENQDGEIYRPLLHKLELAGQRYAERRVLYAKYAHWIVDVADQSPRAIAQVIVQALPETCRSPFGPHPAAGPAHPSRPFRSNE